MIKILITFIVSFVFCASDLHAQTANAPKAQGSKYPSSKASTKGAAPAKESIKKGVSIDQLEGPRLSAAIGHFSRARQLLIGAVNEFDAGLKIGNPDLLMNSGDWRRTVLSQADELSKVLAPQAAEAKGGIKYQGDPRLLTESKP